MKTVFLGVYRVGDKQIATKNSVEGFKAYEEEKLIKEGKNEYRIWDPLRSKLAAAIVNGLREFPITENSNTLYLGASTGTTSSHIADITPKGLVYCIEFAPRMMRELMINCGQKKNMIPILADARHPWEYASKIGRVDVVYQDVAQKNQAEILLRNTEAFKAKHALLSIKSRSISSVKNPKQVFREEIEKLKAGGFNAIETIDLRPHDKDHVLVNLARK